jgi:hypothetical protein
MCDARHLLHFVEPTGFPNNFIIFGEHIMNEHYFYYSDFIKTNQKKTITFS